MTHAQEIEIRERAARETFEVDQLRGLAMSALRDAERALSAGLHEQALRLTTFANDFQGHALAIERCSR